MIQTKSIPPLEKKTNILIKCKRLRFIKEIKIYFANIFSQILFKQISLALKNHREIIKNEMLIGILYLA